MTFSATLPNFSSDYQEGAHARVLDALVATNMEQSAGYGTDEHCERARDLIREACQAPRRGRVLPGRRHADERDHH